MKALSVRQPYASLIATGAKPFEYRTWRPMQKGELYRGPIVICASRKRDDPRIGKYNGEEQPTGCTVCVVHVVGVRRLPNSRTWAWRLAVDYQLPAIPVLGQLGLWTPSPDLLEAIGVTT